MKMDGAIRSGGVLKKRNSSGCLVIRKKDDNKYYFGGLGDLNRERKRRPAFVGGDWGLGKEEALRVVRSRLDNDKSHPDSIGYCAVGQYEKVSRKNDAALEIKHERKRSRSGLFFFDDYDEVDMEDRPNKMVEFSGRGDLLADKSERDPYLVGSSSTRYKADDFNMPSSLSRLKYHENGDKPIRLQGKNGVLKVMVNKKKRMDLPSIPKNYNPMEFEERKGQPQEFAVMKDAFAQRPCVFASNPSENQSLFNDKGKSVEKRRDEGKLVKAKQGLNEGRNVKESVIDRDDMVLKLGPPDLQTCFANTVAEEEDGKCLHASVISLKDKEGKVKRGGSTEKQMLREKIRQMLVDARWNIDYRRRRNREYLDAVYISPSGTAYWSIIKAYEAFKKHLEEESVKCKSNPSSAPVSEDLINKLTRKTKKKIELERQRKMEEDEMIKSGKASAARETSKIPNSDWNEKKLSLYMKQTQKGTLRDAGHQNEGNLNDSSPRKKPRKVTVERSIMASNSNAVEGQIGKIRGRCAFQVHNSKDGEDSESKEYITRGGRTNIFSWLIDSGVVRLSEKVQYFNHNKSRVILEGWITREGIHCGCCSKILTISKFELHAGGKLCQPFPNLFLESGTSLLQCQIDAWNLREQSLHQGFHNVVDLDDPNDGTCGICGNEGDLICCDSCPSTFHQACLEIQTPPSGNWHCSSCKCKFCLDANENAAEENDVNVGELLRCSFCGKRYHKSCSLGLCALPSSLNGAEFCGSKCQEIYEHLQKILGVKHELGAGYSWSLIQRTDVSDALQHGFPRRVECNSKLAIALGIMDECFFPIFDRSGVNIVHNLVLNCRSNYNRLNYNGFYTAILEHNDEIISASSIRIHGTHLAEMPLIGTREIYRGQGMCRRLLSVIERELCSLEVGKLVIPVLPEDMNRWTTVFGFHPLDDMHKKEIKFLNMVVFPGTEMLQKQLQKREVSEESPWKQPQLPVLVRNSFVVSSMEQKRRASSDPELLHEATIICEDDVQVSTVPQTGSCSYQM